MSDWQVGDLAVCVRAGPCQCGCGGTQALVEGRIYRVLGIVVHPERLGLDVGVEPPPGHSSLNAARFRKILPDKHEPCEEEFVTLLNRKKVSA